MGGDMLVDGECLIVMVGGNGGDFSDVEAI